MAQIAINEVSQNYTYNIGTSSFATVALPITASWGPAYTESESGDIDAMLESVSWSHFPATQIGLETFISTYRGPSSNYRLTKDFSYQMAVTLLTAGYNILVCRVCPGSRAEGSFSVNGKTFGIKAKYFGTFGNNLKVVLTPVKNHSYWNLVAYVVDSSGIQTAVENLIFVFDEENSTDSILHISEIESNFFVFSSDTDISDPKILNGKWTVPTIVPNGESNHKGDIDDGYGHWIILDGGSDIAVLSGKTTAELKTLTYNLAKTRYTSTAKTNDGYTLGCGYAEKDCDYLEKLNNIGTSDSNFIKTLHYKEWCYNAAFYVYNLLQDKLNYNPQRIISPGWDDQEICSLTDGEPVYIDKISPLHRKIMETAYKSRCATGMIDIPHSCARADVYNESVGADEGYAQKLARIGSTIGETNVDSVLYPTHSALFAPWGQFKYVGTGKQNTAPPSFIALLIQRAMILNQPLQYEWALPTNRKHNLKIGKFDYMVPKKLLDVWQKLEGVGVNVLTTIPELGTGLWGNSTLYEVPPATYQALANLSTRYLVNAVENMAYKCGLAITFQYNNEQAYNKFYAGVTPLLDTMKNVGAIDDYYVKMAADINGLDQVNANTVIGKIYLVINGVINDIIIDLVALPPGTDLSQYRA